MQSSDVGTQSIGTPMDVLGYTEHRSSDRRPDYVWVCIHSLLACLFTVTAWEKDALSFPKQQQIYHDKYLAFTFRALRLSPSSLLLLIPAPSYQRKPVVWSVPRAWPVTMHHLRCMRLFFEVVSFPVAMTIKLLQRLLQRYDLASRVVKTLPACNSPSDPYVLTAGFRTKTWTIWTSVIKGESVSKPGSSAQWRWAESQHWMCDVEISSSELMERQSLNKQGLVLVLNREIGSSEYIWVTRGIAGWMGLTTREAKSYQCNNLCSRDIKHWLS